MTRLVTEAEFSEIGRQIIFSSSAEPGNGGPPLVLNESDKKKFSAYFGATPLVCSYIWRGLYYRNYIPKGGYAIHLLWALMFLKLYGHECTMAPIAGVTEKTFRKYCWSFVKQISKLKPFIVSINFYFSVTLNSKQQK